MTSGIPSLLRSAVLTAGAVLGTICLLWTLGLALLGLTPLVVLSGSMAPALHPGDVAFARTVAATEVTEGDIVSVVSGDGTRITHRVVEARDAGAGTVALRLQGDANESPDAQTYTVTAAQLVVGRVVGLGTILHVASSPGAIAFGIALLLGCLLIGWRSLLPSPIPSDADGSHPSACERPRRSGIRRLVSMTVVMLLAFGAVSSPRQTTAYFTDTPTARTPVDGLDAAPWFTCHQAMTSAALSAFAYWRMNDAVGSTTAADSSVNDHPLQVYGPAGSTSFGRTQPCRRDTDTAVHFNGSGYASTGTVANLTGTAGARWNTFTISLWFRGGPGNTHGSLMGMGSTPSTAGANDRKMYVDTDGRLRFGVWMNNTFRTLVTPAIGQAGYVDFRAAVWHMATGTLSSSGIALYIDGTKVPLSTTEQGDSVSSITSGYQYEQAGLAAHWVIGYVVPWPSPGSTTPYGWRGDISKVGIWDRALTDRQIRDLYRSGIPVNG
jgi:signal peptidase I